MTVSYNAWFYAFSFQILRLSGCIAVWLLVLFICSDADEQFDTGGAVEPPLALTPTSGNQATSNQGAFAVSLLMLLIRSDAVEQFGI